MKEDNISQLGDYDAPFSEQYTHGSCYISLFKFKSFDQFYTPRTASNFKHLLSCGTIVQTYMNQNKPVNVTSQGTDYYFTRKCFRDAKNTTSKMENLGNTNLLILLSDVQ